MAKKPIHLYIDKDEWQTFRALCIKQGITAVAVIRQFIKDKIRREGREDERGS